MEDVKNYIKEKKIPLKYFVEKMGYTKEHISGVICGRLNPSDPFIKLFRASLENMVSEDLKKIQHIDMIIKNPVAWQ